MWSASVLLARASLRGGCEKGRRADAGKNNNNRKSKADLDVQPTAKRTNVVSEQQAKKSAKGI
jgi:hypothetical protein